MDASPAVGRVQATADRREVSDNREHLADTVGNPPPCGTPPSCVFPIATDVEARSPCCGEHFAPTPATVCPLASRCLRHALGSQRAPGPTWAVPDCHLGLA
jgi:hypothetical protein